MSVTELYRVSQQMRDLGILQCDPALVKPAQHVILPDEKEEVQSIIAHLTEKLNHICAVHNMTKGAGIAAPQIGIGKTVAILVPQGSHEMITLINPYLIDESLETDEQFEGCLSFFEFRGKVTRPKWVDVANYDLDGNPARCYLEDGAARLACHEIDHLNGVLYPLHLERREELITMPEYHGEGQPWKYSDLYFLLRRTIYLSIL